MSSGQPPQKRAACQNNLEQQLARFPALHRAKVRRFAQNNPIFADLTFSYPAMAFALVTGFGRRDDRQAVMELLREGSSMIDLADQYGLPRWLRKLPPEALEFPLPDFGPDPDFNRRLGDLVIQDVRLAARWLRLVSTGLELCGTSFALWIARQKIYSGNDAFWKEPYATRCVLEPLALYAWYSQNEVGEPTRFLDRKWTPKMGFTKALEQTVQWLHLIKAQCSVDNRAAKPTAWYPAWKDGGYRIIPLMQQSELDQEGEQMNHCVATYGSEVRAGQCCIYSVRKGAKTLATIELIRVHGSPDRAALGQVSGPGNAPPPRKIARLVEKWYNRLNTNALPEANYSWTSAVKWRGMWKRYLAARKGVISPVLQVRWAQPHAFDDALGHLIKLAE